MDSLPAAAAAVIAAHLLDERDLAALAATSRFWRGVLADPALWRQLLRSRFGPAAEAAEASGSQPILVPAENGPAAMQTAARTRDEVPSPRQLFRRLACLRRPAPQLDRFAWLDGTHLQAGAGRAARTSPVWCTALAPQAYHRMPTLPSRPSRLVDRPLQEPLKVWPLLHTSPCRRLARRLSPRPEAPAGGRCVSTLCPGWSWPPGCQGCSPGATAPPGACACRQAGPWQCSHALPACPHAQLRWAARASRWQALRRMCCLFLAPEAVLSPWSQCVSSAKAAAASRTTCADPPGFESRRCILAC